MKISLFLIVISILNSTNGFSLELNQFADQSHENHEGMVQPQDHRELVEVQRRERPSQFSQELPLLATDADSDPTFLTVNSPPEGEHPSDFEFSPDGSRIGVVHLATQNLVVFDSDTRDVESVVALSGSPQALAFSPDNIHAVITNLFEDTISIIDLNLGQEVAVVAVGGDPSVVRITSDGVYAVVGNTQSSSLSVVDIAEAMEIREIPGANIRRTGSLEEGFEFTEFEITPDNETVVFPDVGNDQIVFFDIDDGSSTTVPVVNSPRTVSIDSSGTIGLVYQGASEYFLGVIDIPNKSISRTIPLGETDPRSFFPSVGINGSGTQGFVVTRFGIKIIDLMTDIVTHDIETSFTEKAAYTYDGAFIVMADFDGSVVNASTGAVVDYGARTVLASALAVSPVNHRAVIGNFPRTENLWVLDTNGVNGSLEQVVNSGPPPEGDFAEYVAITPDGEYAITVNSKSQNASIFDLDTKTLMSVVPIAPNPSERHVAITPDGRTGLVRSSDTSLAIIDIETGDSEYFPFPARAGQIVVSQDGQFAYVASFSPSAVRKMTLNPPAILGPRITTGTSGWTNGFWPNGYSGLTLSGDGGTLVVCGSSSDNISIIDTSSWQEVARVPVGDYPFRAAFSRDESYIYVANMAGDSVSIVENSGASSKQVSEISVDDHPVLLAVHPIRNLLYVINQYVQTVSVIDLEIQEVIETIPFEGSGNWLIGLAIRPDGRELYVATREGELHVIDTESNSVIKSISTDRFTNSMAYSPGTDCVVMAHPEVEDGITYFCPSEYFFDSDFE